MGEMADEIVNQMIEQGMWGFACRRNRSAYGPPLKCHYCGSTNVYWQAVKGKHVMYDKDSLQPHECAVNDTEGFDDVG